MLWDEDRYQGRWQIIESIQDWFRRNDRFWLYLSILSFGALFTLEIILIFTSQINHLSRAGADVLVIPLLGVYAFAMFWRSVEQSFLTFAGILLTYFGVFVAYTPEITRVLSSPTIANKLGVGIKNYTVVNPSSVGETYFIIGMFALAFSLAIAIKPKFFKPRRY